MTPPRKSPSMRSWPSRRVILFPRPVRAELVEAPLLPSTPPKRRTAPFDCLAGAQDRLRQAQGERKNRHVSRRLNRRRQRHQPRLEHARSEEHTSELQSLMRISYAVFCSKKKKQQEKTQHT